jgi:hypothetical protein
VSEDADSRTWTCKIETQSGGLLSLKALARTVGDVGEHFSVRGVEATVEGWLIQKKEHFFLQWPGSTGTLQLASLTHKVQWDPRLKRAYPASLDEREALKRLVANWNGRPFRIQIVGPLVETRQPGMLILEVRQFVLGQGSVVTAPFQAAQPKRVAGK